MNMKQKQFLILTVIAASLFLFSSMSLAAQGANLVYSETDLGSGLWQYDYAFYNTSNNNEYL